MGSGFVEVRHTKCAARIDVLIIPRRRRTKLGQSIRDMLLSSDSEDGSFVYPDLDSEDEVGDLLVASSSLPWREPLVSHSAVSHSEVLSAHRSARCHADTQAPHAPEQA